MESTATNPIDSASLESQVIEVLRTCYDPEIPVNIYELGLIYEVKVDPSGEVGIKMTLTSPSCPVAGTLPGEVEAKVRAIPDRKSTRLNSSHIQKSRMPSSA